MTTLMIVELYDMKQINIPEEMRTWQITDAELAQHLRALTRQHAHDFNADVVEAGDGVVSASGEQRFYLYPGLDLPGAEESRLLIGRKRGDTLTLTLKGRKMVMTIERILRRRAHELNDAFIQSLGGTADSLSAYEQWYREDAGVRKKERVLHDLTTYLIGEMAAHSRFNLAEPAILASAERWLDENMPLTEDEVDEAYREAILEQHLNEMKVMAVNRYLCERNGIEVKEDQFQEMLDSLAEMPGGEDMLDAYREMLVNSAYADQAAALLEPYVRTLLEEN